MAEAPTLDPVQTTRTRKRIESVKIDKGAIAQRIEEYYKKDSEDRGPEEDARLQRYAKYRMWRESRKDWPWENASDAAIPDMMTASMRLQDTLHNAVMTQRPPIMAKATQSRGNNQELEEKINHLIDWQFFEEQPGEDTVGQLADDFVNEGFFTCYTPWIKETRYVESVKVFGKLDPSTAPIDYFRSLLEGEFPRGELTPAGDGWDWKIVDQDGKRARASFFTNDVGELETDFGRETTVYDGPRAIRKGWHDILHPARCENLQIKGPSNPTGATHVIMRDFPAIDEIQRLYRSKFYDLMTQEDADKLGVKRMDESYQGSEQQKDVMQGHSEQKEPPKGAESHKPLTRLMVFDTFDINGDGLDEDVIFWFILETKTVLRAKYLTQMFPMNPPRRPFGEAQLFPVPGRREGIGLLEMMEGMHDLSKITMDQGVDGGTMRNALFGFYRAASNMRPEVIRMMPGELYPLTDPKNDVYFPPLPSSGDAYTMNMLTILNQMEERLTNIGDLQLGRVPQGKASALRTVSGMQTVLAQGDARPERVLRRFFIGLTQIWEMFHALNEVFLPHEKRFMLCGYIDPRKDPYATVKKSDIRGKYRFTFSQNALNTSKEALQTALQDLMVAYINPLAIQMGMLKPDGAYRLLRDYGRAKGPDPDRYLSPPTPGAMEPPIFFEEAVLAIQQGVLPSGTPAEGAQQHFQKLMEFMQSDEFGLMPTETVPLYRAYMEQVAQIMAQEQAAMQLAAAAEGLGDSMKRPGVPGPAAGPQGGAQANPAVQSGELLDETLPSAGGGANAGAYA